MKNVYTALICLLLCLYCQFAWANAVVRLQHPIWGSWFSQSNTNEWLVGIYSKRFYYEKEFWEYVAATDKGNTVRFQLKKGQRKKELVFNVKNDSTMELASKTGNVLLTNKPRFMASNTPLEAYTEYKPTGDSIYISGYIDHRDFTSIQEVECRVGAQASLNFALKNVVVDSSGLFSISLPLIKTEPKAVIRFGGIFEYLFMRPGDTAIMYIDLAPYMSKKTDDEINQTDCKKVVAGSLGAFNNEQRRYNRFASKWDKPQERYEMAVSSNEKEYQQYEMKRRAVADSVANAYKASYGMSGLLWETIAQTNKYEHAYSLLEYAWGNVNGEERKVSDDYVNYFYSFGKVDKKSFLSHHTYVNSFMNWAVWKQFDFKNLRADVDSIVNQHSLEDFLNYVVSHDSRLPAAEHELLDSLREQPFVLCFKEGIPKLNGDITGRDTAAVLKKMELFKKLLEYISDKQLFWMYYSRHEFEYMVKLYTEKLLRGVELDWALEYSFVRFMMTDRLLVDDAFLQKLQSAFTDTATYTTAKRQLLSARNRILGGHENLLLTASMAEPTILNQLAQQFKGKPIMIDLWATWCGPCIQQFPNTRQIKKQLEGKPVVFVYLCGDSKKDEWQNAIKKYGIEGEHLLLTDLQVNALKQKYQFDSYPQYMLIDADGRLVDARMPPPELQEYWVNSITNLLQQ